MVPKEVWRQRLPLTDEQLRDFSRKWGLTEFAIFGSILWDDYKPDDIIEAAITFAPGVTWPWTGLPQMQDELLELTGRAFAVGTRAGIEQASEWHRSRVLKELTTVHAP